MEKRQSEFYVWLKAKVFMLHFYLIQCSIRIIRADNIWLKPNLTVLTLLLLTPFLCIVVIRRVCCIPSATKDDYHGSGGMWNIFVIISSNLQYKYFTYLILASLNRIKAFVINDDILVVVIPTSTFLVVATAYKYKWYTADFYIKHPTHLIPHCLTAPSCDRLYIPNT